MKFIWPPERNNNTQKRNHAQVDTNSLDQLSWFAIFSVVRIILNQYVP